jgi:hypothetical protein
MSPPQNGLCRSASTVPCRIAAVNGFAPAENARRPCQRMKLGAEVDDHTYGVNARGSPQGRPGANDAIRRNDQVA